MIHWFNVAHLMDGVTMPVTFSHSDHATLPTSSPHHPTVAKVGGSLYDLPDLADRLQDWFNDLNTPYVMLVPGGGGAANVVRTWDTTHALGEEKAHWLALRALAMNAHFLAGLLPGVRVIQHLDERHELFATGLVPVLDMHTFALADELQPDRLPHTWAVTSDSLAAQVAIRVDAAQLVLLKSAQLPEGLDWRAAGERGCVDSAFAATLDRAPTPLCVRVVNLRARLLQAISRR
jgi:aspartokinase-like uncharacterized kinase